MKLYFYLVLILIIFFCSVILFKKLERDFYIKKEMEEINQLTETTKRIEQGLYQEIISNQFSK